MGNFQIVGNVRQFSTVIMTHVKTICNDFISTKQILGVKNNFCYFSSLITFYYIHEW